ncbi:unnamed protein product [Clavelina lepadiformis]|uniref:Uncharacterized protein n=1 Tax=Clavelina lepadiformis TaxID=159417 RepID=A0ABP0FL48_CLALP
MSTIPATKQSTSMSVSTEALTIVGDSMSVWVYLGPVFAGFSLLLSLILLGICIKNCLKKRQRCAEDRRVSTESDNLEDDPPRESDSLLRNLNKTERNRCQDSGNSSLIRADSRVELSLYQRSDLDNRRDSQFSFSPLTAQLQINLPPRPTSLVISTSSDGATSPKCGNSSTSTLSSDRLDQYTQDSPFNAFKIRLV